MKECDLDKISQKFCAVTLISIKKNKGIRWSKVPRKRLKYDFSLTDCEF